METLDLARWQFGITTVYHFIFVPLTIGLTPLVALLQTFWVKTGKDEWYRLTRFFGKLLLINFALGIVTGIVQEFQFGMNWSEYARLVGDIFGAPLAMEALAAFFIESTFLGVWIFGWGRLSKGVHLASIWLVAFAVNLSAFFILAANSFMQYPVGAKLNPETGRAELDSLGSVLFSELSLSTFWHTISTAFLVAGTFMTGIAVWWVVKSVRRGDSETARAVYRKAAVVGTVALLISGLSIIFSGHNQAQVITKLQPSKIAAAEGLCVTPPAGEGAPFTIAAFGDCSDGAGSIVKVGELPGMLSWLATYDSHATIAGIDQIKADFSAAYPSGQGSQIEADAYVPPVMVTFWSFRLMIGLAVFSALLALTVLLMYRGGRVSGSGWGKFIALVSLPMPFLAATFGWIMTEIGRQPFIVYPIQDGLAGDSSIYLLTQDAVSPDTIVNSFSVWVTVIVFTLIYLVLAIAWFALMKRTVASGINTEESIPSKSDDADESKPLTFAY